MPDATLRKVAGWFAFRYLDKLMAGLAEAKIDSFDEDDAWCRSFLTKVGP